MHLVCTVGAQSVSTLVLATVSSEELHRDESSRDTATFLNRFIFMMKSCKCKRVLTHVSGENIATITLLSSYQAKQ